MDYIKPQEFMQNAVVIGKMRCAASGLSLASKAVLAGLLLSAATALAVSVSATGAPFYIGALIFPLGFVLLSLLGFELATGNFAILPLALWAGQCTKKAVLRNWSIVYLGNFVGSVAFALMFYGATSYFGTVEPMYLEKNLAIVNGKVNVYQAMGGAGFLLAMLKAVLCNWLVTTGVFMGFVSSSTIGKAFAMWLPIFLFFALGFEHAIVNMYLLPMGLLLGADYSIAGALLNNLLPVTIGNLLGGVVMTSLLFSLAHGLPKKESA